MQEEIRKHTKKIHTAATGAHTVGEKLKEIAIEIGIIVFAVTLSIWLHSWSEHRHQQKEVKSFLTDVEEDLNNDLKGIAAAQQQLAGSVAYFEKLQGLDSAQIDSMIMADRGFRLQSNIGTTKLSSGNYEGFKASGKIGFIEEKELKKQLLRYYQEITPDLLEAQRFNSDQLLSLIDYWGSRSESDVPQIAASPQFKFRLQIFLSTAQGVLDSYNESIAAAKQLVAEIQEQKK